MKDCLEFTVEAGRPDSITREKLMALKKNGISRISVNPQTMKQETLDIIGRHHTVEDTIESFKLARELGFDNFTVRINDRRLLKVCADYCGFKPEDCDKVFIILDKMDKIGLDGVKKELTEEGFDPESVEKYVSLYEDCDSVSVSEFVSERLGGNGADIAASLEGIMRCATAATAGGCSLKFDPTLVRGMSYYTGTIFEISMDGYGYSVGGGGRYDEMLAKFSGQKTPACGFSLGFERIVAALADRGFEPPAAERSVAFLASKNMDEEKMLAMLSDAAKLRAEGARVLVTPRMKNVGFQKTKLADDGYSEFVEY